jgi:hypothetical protein
MAWLGQPAVGRDQPGADKPARAPGTADAASGRRASALGTAKPAQDKGSRPAGGDADGNAGEKGLGTPGLVTLDTLLADPKRFEGDELIVDGLYKSGTRLAELKNRDGTGIGWTLPIARNDDRTICTADGKVKGFSSLLLVDDELAPALGRVFAKLRFKSTINPSYKCVISAVGRTLEADGEKAAAVVIVGLEILVGCDYQKVALRQFDKAFRTVKIKAHEASIGYGDGNLWVERLGGEQKFVLPLRQKFRELQVRKFNDRTQAAVDAYIQRELGGVVRAAAVARDQYLQNMDALMGRRFTP